MAGDHNKLPSPKWLVEKEDFPIDEEFPNWSDKDALTFIIGQKYGTFPSLKQLEKVDDDEPPDLYTIERRISTLDYGPQEIMEDLNDLPRYISSLKKANKISGRRSFNLVRNARLLIKIVGEELEKFKSCSDCVAYYYNTNNYFTVPCRKLHSVVYVKKGGAMWPAKTIRVGVAKVLVAYFGHFRRSNSVHQQEWVPFSACLMASTCFLYDITSNRHRDALLEMGTYIQMIARKLKRYYKGFPCHGKDAIGKAVTFKPEYLTMPQHLLSSEPPGTHCSSCSRPIEEKVTLQLVSKGPKEVKQPKVQHYPVISSLVCGKLGCTNPATCQVASCTECVHYFV